CISKTSSVNLNGANTPTLSKHLIPVFNTVTMIILKHGTSFSFTKLMTSVIHVNFDSKFKSLFPYWFSSWWEKHGPTLDLLPPNLKESVKYFSSKYKFMQESQFFPKLFIFIAKNKVPWILKWSYKVNWESCILSRQFCIKWWDKFKIERIIEQVNTEFPLVKAPLMPSTFGTSYSSLPIEGRSKSKLKELARQLMVQASQMNDDDDDDDDASPKSQSSSSQTQNPSNQKDFT
ncbi:unnamed protein product, partial [Prunus brigantina]